MEQPDMIDSKTLTQTISHILADGKGLLAMDESNPTCNKRFAALGIPQTLEMRRAYRDLIATTPGLGESIGGAILYDETIRQAAHDGTPFPQVLERQGIVPGIKVDAGSKALALHEGEQVTEGLDGLRERLAEYRKMGARFAKWRAVITIDDRRLPSRTGIEANAQALARYAALCQEAAIVPIVEPEVLMDGAHTLERCAEVTERALHFVFAQLRLQRVIFEGMLLKPNMVVPGLKCEQQASADEVADTTIAVFRRVVPAAVGGIAFLSGGQSAQDASARLNAMNARNKGTLPWPVGFSYARAIQDPAMKAWAGNEKNVPAAQAALAKRAHLNRLARKGEYSATLE
jgi:fructose-bisphosphate aldolase class I